MLRSLPSNAPRKRSIFVVRWRVCESPMQRHANELKRLKHAGASQKMFIAWWRRKCKGLRLRHTSGQSKKNRSWPSLSRFAEMPLSRRKHEPSRRSGSRKRSSYSENLKTRNGLGWRWRRFKERKRRHAFNTIETAPRLMKKLGPEQKNH